MRNVRATAEVDQGAAAVRRARGTVGHLGLDDLALVLVVGEHIERVLLGELEALERLLLLDDEVHELLDVGKVLGGYRLLGARHRHVVVEAAWLVDRRADAQEALVAALECLAQDVRRRVPEGVLALGRVEHKELELAVGLERALQVPRLAVDAGHHGVLCEAGRDRRSNVERRRLPRDSVLDGAVRQRDLDRNVLLGGAGLLLLDALPHREAVRHVLGQREVVGGELLLGSTLAAALLAALGGCGSGSSSGLSGDGSNLLGGFRHDAIDEGGRGRRGGDSRGRCL